MHVTIIAKAPVAGDVKTRLCPPCTPEQAARIAAAALADTFVAVEEVAAVTGARRVLLLDGVGQDWMPKSFEVVFQRGAGLGQRLCNGFVDLGPGVIVGMETPHVVSALAGAIEAARCGIDTIGLALDGGYWMIGLCAESAVMAPELFEGVAMSATHTGLSQIGRLHAHGRRVRLLPTARDLDTVEDLKAVVALGGGGTLAVVAAEVLATVFECFGVE
jgi:uncharacterized protein